MISYVYNIINNTNSLHFTLSKAQSMQKHFFIPGISVLLTINTLWSYQNLPALPPQDQYYIMWVVLQIQQQQTLAQRQTPQAAPNAQVPQQTQHTAQRRPHVVLVP